MKKLLFIIYLLLPAGCCIAQGDLEFSVKKKPVARKESNYAIPLVDTSSSWSKSYNVYNLTTLTDDPKNIAINLTPSAKDTLYLSNIQLKAGDLFQYSPDSPLFSYPIESGDFVMQEPNSKS